MKFREGWPSGPGSDGTKEKYLIYAAVGTAGLLGLLTLLEFNNKEITWKEFINLYLSKGIVEKLEVVNKKWVRVRLPSGNHVDGGVTSCFPYIFRAIN